MKILVKQATLTDINEVSELFNAYRAFYKQDADLDLAIKFISERIKKEESVIFIAYDDRNIAVGFTQLYPMFSSVSAKRLWVLNDLFVSQSSRKLGVAKELMNSAKAFASETGAKGISLATAETNVNAQALYESLGYIRNSEFYHYSLNLE